MSEKGSVFQKGGGTNFEQSIQAAFLLGLAIKGSAPCLSTNEIIEVSFQNTSKGFETDDLLVVTKSHIGERKLLMQIKHDVSFTENDRIFQEVLHASWRDYTPIRRFEEKLEEFKQIQRRSPPNQIVKHQHSFKNWQWLAVLFLFIGLSVLLGWYALDNYYEANDLKIKYEFVRKEMPNHIRLVDSTYQANPDWIKDYKEPPKMIKEKQLKKKKKHH